MRAVYTYRWTSAITEDIMHETMRVWQSVLKGLTPHDIGRGVERMKMTTDPWPPTPGQFRAWCLPDPQQDLGLPSPQEAYQQAAGIRPVTADAVREARDEVGSHELRNLPASITWPKFRDAYTRACERASHGVKAPPPQAPPPPRPRLVDTRGTAGNRSLTQLAEMGLEGLRRAVRAKEQAKEQEKGAEAQESAQEATDTPTRHPPTG